MEKLEKSAHEKVVKMNKMRVGGTLVVRTIGKRENP
jgi:hypothetical protein